MREKILIYEEDSAMHTLISNHLHHLGYNTIKANQSNDILALLHNEDPDLVMLDTDLTLCLQICNRIRHQSHIPMIIISDKTAVSDKLLGLEAGADDYITIPFNLDELGARVKSNLRWGAELKVAVKESSSIICKAGLRIDLNSCEVSQNEKSIQLTPKELQLLIFLMKSPNRIFTTEQLFQHIWGESSDSGLETVKVHIRQLRKKIEINAANPKLIVNIRGIGYKFQS